MAEMKEIATAASAYEVLQPKFDELLALLLEQDFPGLVWSDRIEGKDEVDFKFLGHPITLCFRMRKFGEEEYVGTFYTVSCRALPAKAVRHLALYMDKSGNVYLNEPFKNSLTTLANRDKMRLPKVLSQMVSPYMPLEYKADEFPQQV